MFRRIIAKMVVLENVLTIKTTVMSKIRQKGFFFYREE